MPIPFVRQYPNGRRTLSEFSCLPEVERLASQFIAAGGCYVCEIMQDGTVRLAAAVQIDGSQEDVETEISENGPALNVAVVRLVQNSARHIAHPANDP